MTAITSATDGQSPQSSVDSAAEPPEAPRADFCPARPVLGRDAEYAFPAAAVEYKQFRSSDGQAVRRFFAGAYRPGWRLSALTDYSAVSHRRSAAGSMILDEVMVQGRSTLEIPAGDTVVVIQPRAGLLSVAGGPATAGLPILIADGMSCLLHCNGARFDVVSIEADVLHKVAAPWMIKSAAQQTRFVDWRPRSRAAVRAWQRALDYVILTLASADTARQPLVVAGMAKLLAGALLECYPSTLTGRDAASDLALPETLKEAVSFIHRHITEDIGINDVAAAVHLTPRAVQYLFRRQLDTTPTEYMRRTRLRRAHQELIAATTSNSTVTEIAQRWGFAHTGRFAVFYRQTYGQSPHTTLRQRATSS
ncbi:AraC family transcriptional regulator [Mycobacterium sp. 852002-51971_SCH5477799-a]|uniref:helix-turn-helix domain-containing protein n=1 Tax=Mycobacterium sp. 852002-51971_SCH5477799-a TaxID=1834106 RepID=UPI0008023EA6|nr:helix-turn-helix domain-containing protein [Mycobacterium sp. 852002-51971_SCH5477799-a]OBF66853.1 AraC family transcriptional regulator [Mycobacterium sp. 852002-51971_SCH5477799-a]